MFGLESWVPVAVALIAAVAAGAANTIAGGGTILSFPVLVWIGLPPVQANATSTVGLWTGSIGGAWSYRSRLGTLEGEWLWLVMPALIGGTLGAWLLVALPATWFASIAPLMVIGASALIAIEPVIRRWLAFESGGGGGRGGKIRRVAGILLISAYGGYFGAGLGILVLVALALLGIENLHEANALKNLLVVGIKGAAVVYFIALGVLDWPFALLMVGGSAVGGWVGGYLVREVEPTSLRTLIVGIGVAMGVIMVVRTYF